MPHDIRLRAQAEATPGKAPGGNVALRAAVPSYAPIPSEAAVSQ